MYGRHNCLLPKDLKMRLPWVQPPLRSGERGGVLTVKQFFTEAILEALAPTATRELAGAARVPFGLATDYAANSLRASSHEGRSTPEEHPVTAAGAGTEETVGEAAGGLPEVPPYLPA
jgi:hypothetical protein